MPGRPRRQRCRNSRWRRLSRTVSPARRFAASKPPYGTRHSVIAHHRPASASSIGPIGTAFSVGTRICSAKEPWRNTSRRRPPSQRALHPCSVMSGVSPSSRARTVGSQETQSPTASRRVGSDGADAAVRSAARHDRQVEHVLPLAAEDRPRSHMAERWPPRHLRRPPPCPGPGRGRSRWRAAIQTPSNGSSHSHFPLQITDGNPLPLAGEGVIAKQ